ncbi:hypothetical protein O6H91_01G101500 [Diphasiastrum complanatum]|uniref:Uncharacterized protein n=1 Tax=Diphasiastrum complanatum TaxID=34168 RepID=A0ACC2EU46_DIPCM|nr:hypothetical protein O6H91_01G101500 [Diphasiastrum complanatum]
MPFLIVQTFDQNCGAKEWKPRRRLIHIVTPLPLSTIKAKGARGKSRGAYSDGWIAGRRHEQQFSACRCVVRAAVGADVALEEPVADPEAPVEAPIGNLEALGNIALEAATEKPSSRRNENVKTNPSRVLVQDKDVVTGAVFTGKVRSILSFGAFIDFGAFTDGLVHISQLSNAFVNSVQDVVSVGQEVQVRVLDVNFTSRRIALTMKEMEEEGQQKRQGSEGRTRRASGQAQSGGEPGGGSVRGKIAGSVRGRKQDEKKKSNFQKGQTVDGKVKNLIRRGAFLELPGGEDGFLPVTEIPGGERTPLENLLPVGKEVSVRIVKVGGGKVGLSMKPVLDLASVNKALNQDVEIGGGNAFEIAFRSNPVIGKYLTDLEEKNNQPVKEKLDVDETAKAENALREEHMTPLAEGEVEPTNEEMAMSAFADLAADESDGKEITETLAREQGSSLSADVRIDGELESPLVTDTVDEAQADEEVTLKTELEISSATDDSSSTRELTKAAEDVTPLSSVENVASTVEVAETEENVDETRGEIATAEEVVLERENVVSVVEESSNIDEATEATEDKTSLSAAETAASPVEIADTEKKIDEEVVVPTVVEGIAVAELHVSDVAAAGSIANGASALPEAVETEVTVPQGSIEQLSVFSKAAEGTAAISSVAAPSFASATVGASDAVKKHPAVQSSGEVTSTLVKKLREETGAGMMDCKKALIETVGDLDKARDYLRKKGLASAEKKVGRIAAEGAIGGYIHDSRIGVLIEVNCETDFVSRGQIFRQLVEDLAMQVVASQQVQYVSVEDVPPEVKNKEVEIELQREDLQKKPEQIRAKIVDGRVNKRLGELALLEQPFIKDDSILVKDLVKQTVAAIGENIRVRRFTRFTLGEGLEKKVQDFVAEVAAQSKKSEVVGSAEGSGVQQSAPNAASATATVHISVAIVKQLREESGAGMMDCKKALVASNGDLEGAREYLRKKGLASADKKASRIAAEGAIGSYIHDSRIGVLIEVNCETDFVSRGETFRQLVEDLAMQVAANQQVDFVSVEDIPLEMKAKERELEMQEKTAK